MQRRVVSLDAVYRYAVLLFPPARTIAVIVNGHPVAAYVHPFERGGRAFAPIRPFVTTFADRVWYEGNVLVIVRGSRVARVSLPDRVDGGLADAYVAIAPLLRALGEGVRYDVGLRAVEITTPDARSIGSARPFDPLAVQVSPRTVFTPAPRVTTRPVWTGVPLPCRRSAGEQVQQSQDDGY